MGAKGSLTKKSAQLEKLLDRAYHQFELDFYGKKVWVPYRINVPFQSDPRRYGKWSPEKIRTDTIEIAKEAKFDLEKASEEEISQFMRQEKLGLDCSGFVYQMLDIVLPKLKIGTMAQIGFPKSSLTNVQLLTEGKFARRIADLEQKIQPGDLIRFAPRDDGRWHILLVLRNDGKTITYGHSSAYNVPGGVGIGQIEINSDKSIGMIHWRVGGKLYDPSRRDGVYRLNVLKYQNATVRN